MLWLRQNKKQFFFWCIFLLLSVPAVLSLLQSGFFVTDDGEWMIIRFSAFYQTLGDGQFPVRFLDRLNFGYGYPVATFLYPGFMYLAVLPQLLKLGFVVSIKIVLGASMVFSGIFIYLWLRKLFDQFSSVVGALFYVYTPYHLYDVYKRGSVGEVLALAVVPFILWQFERKSVFWSALGIGFLILSHNTLAALFLPLICAYFVYQNFQEKLKKPLLLKSLFILLSGLGVSAFFWIPILFELQYTVFARTTISNWMEYFASGPLIGAASIVILLITFINILHKRIDVKKHQLPLFVFIIGVVSVVISLPVSAMVWNALPVSFIQFPFRVLSVTILCIAFLAAFNVSLVKGKARILSGIVLLIILSVSAYSFAKPNEFITKEEGHYSTNDATTTVKDEYMPVWVKEKPTQRFTTKVELLSGEGEIANIVYNNGRTSFNTKIQEQAKIRVSTIYWPGWKASIDGKEVPISYNNQKGLIEISVPQGDHVVEVKFGETPLRLMSDFISIISFIILLLISFKQFYIKNKEVKSKKS